MRIILNFCFFCLYFPSDRLPYYYTLFTQCWGVNSGICDATQEFYHWHPSDAPAIFYSEWKLTFQTFYKLFVTYGESASLPILFIPMPTYSLEFMDNHFGLVLTLMSELNDFFLQS